MKKWAGAVEWAGTVGDGARCGGFDAVILANGDFPTHEVPLGVLHSARNVVACDGAIRHYPQADIVTGDGDSVPTDYLSRLVQVDEQEDNDLTKATRYCLRQFASRTAATGAAASQHTPLRIAYLGCTGKREDHALGNIALLMRYYRDMGIDGRMFTDYGIFTPAHGDCTFAAFPGQQVSIFNFSSTRITSEGLKWASYAYRELWQGTLNEATADHFTLQADGYYLVYQTYPPHFRETMPR